MYALRRYVANLPSVRDFAAQVARYRLTQAVYVEPDDIWQLAWRINRTDPFFQHILDRSSFIPDGDRTYAWWYFNHAAVSTSIGQSAEVDPQYDFQWYPKEIKRVLGTNFPLWVRVHLCHRPEMSLEESSALRRDIQGIALKYGGDFRITLEDRPRAVLAAQSGDKIDAAPGGPGTVGGFLQATGTKDIYGVTCAHVAPSGSVADGAGRVLGSVSAAHFPNNSPSGQLCNPSAGVINELDASLFSCPGATPSGCTGPSTLFGSGQMVQMRGAFSKGPYGYSLGGIGLVHTLHHNGHDYCFKDLFSFRPRLTAPLPLSAAIALSPIPLKGDSGSWITTNGGGSLPEWIGMLVGVDLVEGFAVDADKVHKWASAQTGLALGVW
jgi:hypothetical protein